MQDDIYIISISWYAQHAVPYQSLWMHTWKSEEGNNPCCSIHFFSWLNSHSLIERACVHGYSKALKCIQCKVSKGKCIFLINQLNKEHHVDQSVFWSYSVFLSQKRISDLILDGTEINNYIVAAKSFSRSKLFFHNSAWDAPWGALRTDQWYC